MYFPDRICVSLLLLCFVLKVDGATKNSAVYALVYNDIGPSSFHKCIRIMNGTKQIGCQSNSNGNVGILLHVNKTSDIDKVIKGQHSPYVILLHADMLKSNVMNSFKDAKTVTGIIVYADDGYTGNMNGWSPEPKCPRYIYGLYNDKYGPQYSRCEDDEWNEVGNGLSYDDIEFPVFYMQNKTATDQLFNCYNEHNLDGQYPFCAAQLDGWMHGAVSTETCIRRNNVQHNLSPSTYCQEMGGSNILSMLQSSNSSSPDNRPIILIIAALDSRSFMLQSYVPGANAATGLTAVLTVASVLGNLTQEEKDDMTHRVMFVLFDGEAFDNTGSTRMVYDMSKNKFPFPPNAERQQPENVDLSKVEYIIEIGQIGHVHDQAWVHFDPISSLGANITNMVKVLQEQSFGHSIQFRKPSSDIGLPPSSLQSVLKERNVTGIVVTDFDQNFTNKYYFSAYDTPDKLGVNYNDSMTESEAIAELYPLASSIGEISDIISKTVYKLASGKNLTNKNSDTSLIANTLYCYLFNGSCTYFRQHVDSSASKDTLTDSLIIRYVSVYDPTTLSHAAYLARNLLLSYTGEHVTDITTSKNCKSPTNSDVYQYLAFKRNGTIVCMKAPIYLTDGRSPSAVISSYDYTSGAYPAWSESQWDKSAFKLSVFMVQDPTSQGMMLLSGLLILCFSLVFVIFINKKSNILFNPGDVL